jgi:hypothetical protein
LLILNFGNDLNMSTSGSKNISNSFNTIRTTNKTSTYHIDSLF